MMAASGFPLPDRSWAPLAPFWAAARQGELRLPVCDGCGRYNWYPAEVCPACHGTQFAWRKLCGTGRLYSWAVVDRALHRPLSALGPYIPALVALDEDPSVRLVTRIIDTGPDALVIDMPVVARFADLGHPEVETGILAPLFGPAP